MSKQPQAERVRVTFTCSPGLMEQVANLADEQMRSRSNVIELLLLQALGAPFTNPPITAGKGPEDQAATPVAVACSHQRTKTTTAGFKTCLDCEAVRGLDGTWRTS